MTPNYNPYVLTSDGFKDVQYVTIKDYVYDVNSRLGRVTYACTYPIVDNKQFHLIYTTVDKLPFIVKNNVLTEMVGQSLVKLNHTFNIVCEDDWLFHPWIKRDQLTIKSTIDLSKTSDNFHDVNHIYLFNNKILQIAEHLNISQKAVKEILLREAAEYEEYIEPVYQYVKDNFNVDKSSTDDLSSFKDFKSYVYKNFVFKMNRFVNIDLDYIRFVISTLTRCKINKTSTNNKKSYTYELSYRFESETDKTLIESLVTFATNLNIKYEITIKNKITHINIYNKPLYDYVIASLLVDLGTVLNSTFECQKYFVDNLFLNISSFTACKKVVLQVKELFLYHKKIVGIDEAIDSYSATLYHDDFESLDSTLILSEDGYYTRVLAKLPLPDQKINYTYFETQDKTTVLLNYVRK